MDQDGRKEEKPAPVCLSTRQLCLHDPFMALSSTGNNGLHCLATVKKQQEIQRESDKQMNVVYSDKVFQR